MSTLRANTLKPITSGNSLVLQGDSGGSGVSGPSIDSNGDVDFSQNTDAKVKLPSGGGIYESDGSTEILTESSGAVTLKNTTLDSTIVFPSGHIIQTTLTTKNDEDSATNTSTTLTKVVDGSGNAEWVGQITNVASGNDVLVIMHFNFEVYDNPAKDSAGGGFGIFRNSDATAIYLPPVGATFFQNASSNQGYKLQQTLIHLDESPATGTNDYYLGYRSVVSGKSVLIHSASGELPFSCILQEIQR